MGKNKTVKHKKTYSLNDYKSGDGMLTSVWGPGMWHSLHTMSFNYPVNPTKNDKRNYRDYILNLKNVLPCGKCRENLKKNFKKLPLKMKHMTSRETFSRYVYDLHELINDMLCKKSGLSYDDVRERYEHFRARCSISLKQVKSKSNTKKKKEKGCTEPLYGEKSRCILKIIPNSVKEDTFQIDEKCVKKILD
tara:strand:- start:4983 stop:5558 length:576 start_codon:yes stop_codon:yes gene_type:complete